MIKIATQDNGSEVPLLRIGIANHFYNYRSRTQIQLLRLHRSTIRHKNMAVQETNAKPWGFAVQLQKFTILSIEECK